MSLSVGIVGLPNVGKSTLFNTLLKRQIADTAPYPFTTIKPHTGVVEVLDKKLEKLKEIAGGKNAKMVPATVEFVDIAGLVENAHQGEGLGNEFLGQIRNVDAIVHVIREFEDDSVPHVMGGVDAKRDKAIIELELEMAEIKKPMLEWVNRKKTDFEKVDELIKRAYELLDLITFYTIKGGEEIRAWSLKKGSSVIEAAEKVHTDFAKNFIKVEVIGVDELITIGGWSKARSAGKIRLEGRDYVVKNLDVVEFKVGR